MKTWRDVPWEYEGGRVYAIVDGQIVNVCRVAGRWCSDDAATIGRAIAHAWNVDLAAAESWRELFGVDDSMQDSARV